MDNQGFVILTTPDLKIMDVICNNTDLPFIEEGRVLIPQVNEASRNKILDFSRDISKDKVEFACEINFDSADGVSTFLLSGIKSSDKVLIFATCNEEGILDQYDYLMKINNKYVNQIRDLMKKQYLKMRVSKEKDKSTVFNEMSTINNELVDVQRTLTKVNKELQEQKERYYSILKSIGEGVIVFNYNKEVEFINKVGRDMLGLADKHLGIKDISRYIKITNSKQDFLALIDEAFSKKKLIRVENLLVENNLKKKIPVDLTVSAIKVDKGSNIGVVLVFKDITLHKNQEEKLQKLAATDKLTDTMNKRMGLRILKQQLRIVEENNKTLTICFIDVNGLKKVNDNLGHLEGDNLLKETSEIIQDNIRGMDLLARFGGDEFIIIFKDCTLDQAEKVWERVDEGIAKRNKDTDKPYNISISCGFAEKKSGDGISVNDLLELADEEMYKQKKEYYKS